MKEAVYILSKNSKLTKKQGTLEIRWTDSKDQQQKRKVPIQNVDVIVVLNNVSVTTPLLALASEENIPIVFCNFYGKVLGEFLPARPRCSNVKIHQLKAMEDKTIKLGITKTIVKHAAYLKRQILAKYLEKDVYAPTVAKIKGYEQQITGAGSVEAVRGFEGMIMRLYFEHWDDLLLNLPFEQRSRQPPLNEANAVLSYMNMILYGQCISAVFEAHLEPKWGFLHELQTNRPSLGLDIAELFRPLYVDDFLIRLIRQRIINKKHFTKSETKCLLNSAGKKVLLEAWREFIHQEVFYESYQRMVSYRELILVQVYRLVNYLLRTRARFKPLKLWNTKRVEAG